MRGKRARRSAGQRSACRTSAGPTRLAFRAPDRRPAPPTSGTTGQPAEGSRYVTVDASVTNNDTKPQSVSSLLCFDLSDSTGQTYNQTIVIGAPASPDGEVTPGDTLRGTVAYEIPNGVTGLTMKFKCDLFSSGSASINLGV